MQGIKRTLLIVVSLLLLLCSGCGFDFNSAEKLLRAPKLTGEYGAIEQAFEAAVGRDVTLQAPRAGAFRTAYIMYDYDGDGISEALVFYIAAADATTVRIHFLDYIHDSWVTCADIAGNEKNVYEIVFEDMDANGIPEIIISYDSKRTDRTMAVYNVVQTDSSGFQIDVLSAVQYTKYLCLDMDNDGCKEIFYTVFESSADTGAVVPYVKILKWTSDARGVHIGIAASLPLSTGVSSVAALQADTLGPQTRVYVDCMYLDAATMITEVVAWLPESGYVLQLHKQDMPVLLKTSRNQSLFTQDIDGDGLMEIPGEYELPGSEFENVAEGVILVALCRNYYRCQSDGSLVICRGDYVEPTGKYTLDLVKIGCYGKICIVYDCLTNATTFYFYNADTAEREERLFTLQLKDVNGETNAFFDFSPTGSMLGLTPDSIMAALTMTETEEKE